MSRYIKDFRNRSSAPPGPNDLRNPDRPVYRSPPFRGTPTKDFIGTKGPGGAWDIAPYNPVQPFKFNPSDPASEEVQRYAHKRKMMTVPRVPYKRPKVTFGPGIAKFLARNPAFRVATLLLDTFSPHFYQKQAPGYDMGAGGWTLSFSLGCGVDSAYRAVSGTPAPIPSSFQCLPGQVRSTNQEYGSPTMTFTTSTWVFFGPNTDPVPNGPRMTYREGWYRTVTGTSVVSWDSGKRLRSFPWPQVPNLTDFFPSLDPHSLRPGSFLPTPRPLPFPLVNLPRPGREVGPSSRSDVWEGDIPWQGPAVRNRDEVRPRTRTRDLPAPLTRLQQRLGYKERKILGPWARALLAVWDASTEAQDLVDALADALPEGTCKGKGLSAKSYCVYANFHLINWRQAVQNIIYNAIEDGIAGRLIGRLEKAGVGIGFNGYAYLKRNYIQPGTRIP